MKKRTVGPLLLLALSSVASASASLPTAHAPRRQTEQRVPLAGKDLSSELEAVRSKHGVPGIVALAYQEGEVLAWGAAGVRAAGGDDPITLHDPIHLGSCSKAITATLVARLVDQGALSWDTTLAEALPEFSKKIDPGYRSLRPLTFLQHQAGIAERRRPEVAAYFMMMQNLKGTGPEVRREVLEHILSLPPSPSAEGTFDYSNYGYMTVGLMLEGLTKQTWEELIVEQVFGPMQLTSAGVGSPSGPGEPVGHSLTEEGWKPLPPGPGGALPDAMAPAGLLHMNLMDWAVFVSDHMAGQRGEGGFLKPENYPLLHEGPGKSPYAAGWGIGHHRWDWGEGTLLSHNGSDGTWLSLVFALPDWDMALLIALNCGEGPAESALAEAQKLFLRTLEY